MVGEIRPEFPERELPVDFFGFTVPGPLSDADLSLMTRGELTGCVNDALPTGEDCSVGDALPFDIPNPSGTHDPPPCWQFGHAFIRKP